MPKHIKITFTGIPIAQSRPQVITRYGRTFAFDPSSNKKKEQLKQLLGLKIEPFKDCPLRFELIAYMPIPKSLSPKKQKELEGTPHIKRPDIDNITKAYADMLEGIAYEKDENICWVYAKKIYGVEPKVEIIVAQI